MSFSIAKSLLLACILAVATAGVAHADPETEEPGAAQVDPGTAANRQADSDTARVDNLDGPTEPVALLRRIDERTTQKDSLFPVSPLGWLHDGTDRGKEALYDATGLKLAAAFTHLFQGISDSIAGEDDLGTATTMDLVGILDLFHKGKPTQAQAVVHLQSRWDYGTTGPEDLGGVSLGSVIGTADTFGEYSDPFVVRNLYWRQGSPETGWVYRLGKITPDAILSSSPYLDSQTSFLSSGGTGPFSIALPDSGLGAVGALFLTERVTLAGLISDANADRTDFGDISEGDLFEAVELHVKIAPKTTDAPYSKLTLWHSDGTDDGAAINASSGQSGWGFFLMHQQELTTDGRLVGILRYGKSFDDAAVYDNLAAGHLLFYDPRLVTGLENDAVGLAFTWAETPFAGTRGEANAELFYRFPLFPNVDTTVSYQSVIHPALTREVDHASVFSLRIRSAF
jgi:porin